MIDVHVHLAALPCEGNDCYISDPMLIGSSYSENLKKSLSRIGEPKGDFGELR